MASRARAIAPVVAVLAAAVLGGLLAVWSYSAERSIGAGRISLSVSPFHEGALDLYVPLVDWGARFDGVRLPARLQVELRTVDRRTVASVARRGLGAVEPLRGEARDAIASYLRVLAVLAGVGALGLGLLAAAALRPARPGWHWLAGAAAVGALGWVAAVALLLAPRGALDRPTYYAHGSDIPVALRVVEAATRAPSRLSEELDAQLLGLARLVTAPGRRVPLTRLPRLAIASDLHNNVVALPSVRRAAAGAPLILAGDLSDRGTPLETSAVASVTDAGDPVVFVAGNHDSDRSAAALARAGVVVLTRRGRLLPDGGLGPVIVEVGGLRMAGYESPNVRRARDGYRDRGAGVTDEQRAAFRAWLAALGGRVDVVVVHEPALARDAIAARRTTDADPLVVIAGHTHHPAVLSSGGVVEVNAGTAGGGGTGNLVENLPIGVAILTYDAAPFAPLAVDLVEVAPGTGSGSARRIRLDGGPVSEGDVLAPSPED